MIKTKMVLFLPGENEAQVASSLLGNFFDEGHAHIYMAGCRQ